VEALSTSGGGSLNAALYLVMLACSVRAGRELIRADVGHPLRRPALGAAGLWLAVAVPSLAQVLFGELLRRLQRDPELIRHGQWWRLVTSGVVQDGGIPGTVFNLAVLAVIAVLAVRVWGTVRAASLFLVGLVAFNLAATFASPAVGAGNSAATFALATSMIGLALVVHRQRVAILLAGLTLIDAIALLALGDAHGEVVAGGLVIGLGLGLASPPGGVGSPAA
jgi:membrane associated rhomboid family serine protease